MKSKIFILIGVQIKSLLIKRLMSQNAPSHLESKGYDKRVAFKTILFYNKLMKNVNLSIISLLLSSYSDLISISKLQFD